MAHEYTVSTPKGDVHLTTQNHHTEYQTLGHFIEDHKGTIATALGITALGVQVLGLWLSHGRKGGKIL